jgi:hypothetical protein
VAGNTWREAWVNGVSDWLGWGSAFRIVQNEGTGLLITGAREWQDYRVASRIRPHLAERVGIAARVQGMRRWYGLLLHRDNTVRLVKNDSRILAEAPFAWSFGEEYLFEIEVQGNRIRGFLDGQLVVDITDETDPLTGGGISFVLEDGRIDADEISISPLG